MTERLFQFIWQFQYFNRKQLRTNEGAALQIMHPGRYNTNQGPDFLEASVRIDQTILIGNIELHINTSDWHKHGHHEDAHYRNIILHVAWNHDMKTHMPGIPLLTLQDRVPQLLVNQYQQWMEQTAVVPCANGLKEIKDITWAAWKDRLLAERLLRKSAFIDQLLRNNNQHWEETCWQVLARSFGMQVNADAFEHIAQVLPLSLLARHKQQPTVLEALLMGQAGLLENNFTSEYAQLLQREYLFHKHKYRLPQPPAGVNFLRMRPAAFPTIRLSQLAMLVHGSTHLFTMIKEMVLLPDLRQKLDVSANDYWHYHYRFDEPAAYRVKRLGSAMLNHLIINAVCPLLFAYGTYHNEQALKDRALQWLSETAEEDNGITREWKAFGISGSSAYHSQAMIELKTQYCDHKRCLDCAIGNVLLRKGK